MIRLLVTLDAPHGDRCGFCTLLARPTGTCVLFGEALALVDWGFRRCGECLRAERLQSEDAPDVGSEVTIEKGPRREPAM